MDCFWQDKLCPNMRIISNLKDKKIEENGGIKESKEAKLGKVKLKKKTSK